MDAPLPNIPLPVIEREPDFQVVFDNRIAQMRGVLETSGLNWDTWMLRSDPFNNVCRHAAYGDLLMVAALNDTFRASLTDFAQGADLLALASDWDLPLADGQALEDLRRVLRETKKGQGGFTDNWYKRWAFRADPRVADVGVAGDGKGGVLVSILSALDGGVASDELLAVVAAHLNQPHIRGDNDHIDVVRAVIRVVNVEANLWFLPEADIDTAKAAAEDKLKVEFAASRRLGWDFGGDFALAALRTTGIKRVQMVSPAADAYEIAGPAEAIALGSIKLNPMGRAY
jgi:phage-related baseplate assembly protein